MDTGEWTPDAQLPSEHALCNEFGISRTTVRQTISELVAEPGNFTLGVYFPFLRAVSRS